MAKVSDIFDLFRDNEEFEIKDRKEIKIRNTDTRRRLSSILTC